MKFLTLDSCGALGRFTVLADPKIEVYFSPRAVATEAVVDALSKAKATVLVQAYSFTSPAISKALVEAQRRGVKIQVILDKSNRTDRYSTATFTQNYGIPTFIDDRHAIAHNKIIIIDGQTVLTARSISRSKPKNTTRRICS